MTKKISNRGSKAPEQKGSFPVAGIWASARGHREQPLQLGRDRLTTIMNSMKDGVFIINQQCDVEYINPVLLGEFGPVNGRKCYQYLHDREQVCPWCRNQEVFAGKTVHWEWRSEKSGKTYDLLDTPLRNLDGSLSKLEIFRDITERKLMEEELRESEELHRITLSAMSDAVFITDETGEMTFICPNVDVIFGYSVQEVNEMGNISFLLGDLFFDINELESTNEIPNIERLITDKSGQQHTLLVTVKRVDIRGGTVLYTCRDITERKQIEEQLKESEKRYRTLYEEAPNAYFSVGIDGRIERANSRAVELLGYSVEELVGRPVIDLYANTSNGRAKAQEVFQRFLAGDEIRDEELEMCRVDGSSIWISLTVRPIRDNRGRVVAGRSAVADITDRKQLVQLKDEFIGLVSHELRTPLTVITGCLNAVLTENSYLSPVETHQLLQDALLETGSLAHLVGNLLELSRSQAGQLTLYAEPIRFTLIVSKVVEKISSQYPTHNIKIDLPSHLPSVSADPLRLERILYNLLENGVKYSPRGSEVRLFGKLEDDRLVIGIADKGVGISLSDQAKLFGPFQRLEQSVLDGIKGAGLGLLVCRRLVEAHGGRIWLESEPGCGSTFFFSIPLK